MTLPAFAAERRRLLCGDRSAPAAIDQYLLPAVRLAANPPHAVTAVNRWGRHTDRRLRGQQTLFRILCGQRRRETICQCCRIDRLLVITVICISTNCFCCSKLIMLYYRRKWKGMLAERHWKIIRRVARVSLSFR